MEKNTEYRPVQGEFELEGEVHTGYGISVYCGEEKLDEALDLSTNRAEVEALAAACTKQKLSPIHFMDVIEDFLV